MMQYNPRRETAIRAPFNPQVAQYDKMFINQLNKLGDTAGEIGQDVRSGQVADLIGSGALDSMTQDEARAAVAQLSQGDINEQTNKNVDSLFNIKSNEETAALEEVNRVKAASELVKVQKKQQDDANLHSLFEIEAKNMDAVEIQEMKDESALGIQGSKNEAAAKRDKATLDHQKKYGYSVADGVMIDGKFTRTKGSGQSAIDARKEYGKTLTGFVSQKYKVSSKNDQNTIQWLKENDPDFNILPNMVKNEKTGKMEQSGFKYMSGNNTAPSLAELKKRMIDFQKVKKKQEAKTPIEVLTESSSPQPQSGGATISEPSFFDKLFADKKGNYGGSRIRDTLNPFKPSKAYQEANARRK